MKCGTKTCQGDEPWCVWSANSGQCVAAETYAGGEFRCDDDADCLPNERCWLTMTGSYCCRGQSCFDHAATSKYVTCETAADCPKLEGMTFSCEPDDELPPHIPKRCFPHYH